MKKFLAASIFVFITISQYAQTERFDIANFVAPRGWQRIDSNGLILFQDQKTNNNLTGFCQIFLYPSQASSNTPVKNFLDEWNNRVAKTTGAKTIPGTQTEKTPDGWTVVTGTANLSAKGMTYACILVTVSGFGKVMSVVVNTAGGDYATTIEKFFNERGVA